jgi:AcrR family transcriptional regulator
LGRHILNAKEGIIDAAEDVVVEVGARHLTLDAVSAKAGVSKGGLLYHFHNKEALLQAMLDRRISRIEVNRQEKRSCLSGGADSDIIAHVLAVLEADEKSKKLSVALLAAVAHDPLFLVPYQKEYRRLLDRFRKEGNSFSRAAVIMLAADGLKLLELFSLLPFSPEERKTIVAEIISLSKEGGRGQQAAKVPKED